MRYFLPARKINIAGIQDITQHAQSAPQSVNSTKLSLNSFSPTLSVRIFWVFVIINGHIKLFHVPMKVNIAKVTMAGVLEGRIILKNVSAMLQPSILAESSSSLGNPRNHWRIRNIPKPPKKPGTMSAWYVLHHPSSLIMKNSGTILT